MEFITCLTGGTARSFAAEELIVRAYGDRKTMETDGSAMEMEDRYRGPERTFVQRLIDELVSREEFSELKTVMNFNAPISGGNFANKITVKQGLTKDEVEEVVRTVSDEQTAQLLTTIRSMSQVNRTQLLHDIEDIIGQYAPEEKKKFNFGEIYGQVGNTVTIGTFVAQIVSEFGKHPEIMAHITALLPK